jgi:predicted dehydrogenase
MNLPRTPRHQFTRRQFTRTALAAAAMATFASPALLRGKDLNDKLNIAVIGAGGRGAADTSAVKSENIVALCDVNTALLDGAAAKFPGAKKFTDYRKLFDDQNVREFDAVIVAVPEHSHALATMLALHAGKHVYCEKPLSHDIAEARRVREYAAARPKLVTQMGIQIHAGENYHRVVELIRGGVIGPVSEAHVWVSRAWGLQSEEAAKRNKDIVYVTDRPKDAMEPPANLDWDLWLGPAPKRPYHSVYFPGPKWYRWWDFGNGTMSDLGSHWNDLPFWALELKAPLSVEAKGPPAHAEIAPASMSATYEYGSRGPEKPAVKLTWYQGESKPEIWERGGIPQWHDGCLFVGSKGMLLADYGKYALLPEKDFADRKPGNAAPAAKAKGNEHQMEWVQACKSGARCAADFEYAGWLTEANHLGNVAYRVGKKLEWDPVGMKATNAPEASQYLGREYRKGWELPG